VLALLYLFVRDYKTVALKANLNQVSQSLGGTLKHIFGTLARTRTLLWACIAGAMQLITMSAVSSWLPSYLNRFHGMAPADAAKHTAGVILVSAFGVIFWGIVVDRLALRTPRNKLPLLSMLCVITSGIFMVAFGGTYTGDAQFKLIVLGGFFMTSIMGVITGIAMDVIHPGMRSTGAAVLAVVLNLFGLAVGPFLAGVLSDQCGLQQALAVVPLFSTLAAVLFIIAMRSYDADVAQISDVKLDVAPVDRVIEMAPGESALMDRRAST
jgi:MFS family permease